jgi:hypothetical protein
MSCLKTAEVDQSVVCRTLRSLPQTPLKSAQYWLNHDFSNFADHCSPAGLHASDAVREVGVAHAQTNRDIC